jgi:ParB/RepB/Spo0J family partition protein
MRQGKSEGQGGYRSQVISEERILHLPVAEVIIGKRHRKDLGDIEGLARSISEIGLLHPIVVRPGGVLIAGERRLAAYKRLGLPEIPARVVDLEQVLSGELAENICRKGFNPSELVAIGRALEELEREKSRERQVALGKSHGTPSGKFPEGSKGQTRDKVAAALGQSGRTYEKAAEVVQAAEKEPERFGHLVEEMDRSGKVDGVYRKLRMVQDEELLYGLDGAAPPLPDVADANADSTDVTSRFAASALKRLRRIWEQRGMRRFTVCLNIRGINALIDKGFLSREQRHDAKAVRGALVDLVVRALEEPLVTKAPKPS